MTRFWSRVSRPFQKEKVSDKHVKPHHHLQQSALYQHHLVRVDVLEQAYSKLQLYQTKKSYQKNTERLVHIWCTDLERITQHGQHTQAMLTEQLDSLHKTLQGASSPAQNRDRRSLKKTQQFITSCLVEWNSTPVHDSNVTLVDYQNSKSIISLGKSDQSFSLIKSKADILDLQFQTHFQNVESRVKREMNTKKSNTKLKQCIRQVYQIEQDLRLHQHYLISQFSLALDLASVCLEPKAEELTHLFLSLKEKCQRQYDVHLKAYQALEAKFKCILASSTPNPKDFSCAICLSIWKEPVTLVECHHTFCKPCVQALYCAKCHQRRASRISRMSSALSIKIQPIVQCTCYVLDPISGDPVLKNRNGIACPLCRTVFKPDQCIADSALENFIVRYFPKQSHDSNEEEESVHDLKAKMKKENRDSIPSDSRRRSQVSASKFYSKMQRWSNKLPQTNVTTNQSSDHPIPIVPYIPTY